MNSHVVVLFGTRPEAIKLTPVVRALSTRARLLRVTVLSTGQHREMLDQTVESLSVEVDKSLDLMRFAQPLTELTGKLILGIGSELADFKPDWVVVQGDTVSAFAGALAAFQARVRVAHVEAGLRTTRKDLPFPEEINRRLIAPIADLHFAPTPRAREMLLREGVAPAIIHVTGNTAIDMLAAVKSCNEDQPRNPALASLFGAGRRAVLVTAHRRENIGEGIGNICEAILRLARGWPDVDFVFPVHHNPSLSGTVLERLVDSSNIHLMPPLAYHDLIAVMSHSTAILTDSGGIQEEAPTFAVPVLVLRETTERTESLDAGYSKLVGTSPDQIVAEAEAILSGRAAIRPGPWQNPYGDGHAAERIADIIASCT